MSGVTGGQPAQSGDAVPRVPNPGSNEAGALGCICPVMDNNYGRSAPWPPDGWWMVAACPVHHPHGQELAS